jgi:hypothetical protein
MVMKKTTLAQGIVVYSDVIPEFNTLINDIEEGAASAGIEWTPSQIRKDDKYVIDTEYRDTMIINIKYNDKQIFIDFVNNRYIELILMTMIKNGILNYVIFKM